MSVDYHSPRALIESGPITIPELFEWNARENSDYPLFRYPNGDGALKTITYAEAIRAIRRVARHILALVGSAERCTVAILANTGMVCFSTSLVNIKLTVAGFRRLYHVYHHFCGGSSCRTHRVSYLHQERLGSRVAPVESHRLSSYVGVGG